MTTRFDSLTGQNDHDGRRGKAEAALWNLMEEKFPARPYEDGEYKHKKLIQAKARAVCRKPFSACDAADIERLIAAFSASSNDGDETRAANHP